VGEFADAAVIGTAVVALIEKAQPGTAPAKIAAFLQGLRQGHRQPGMNLSGLAPA
jgi:tryptophan synthase alpha chain